MTDSDRIAALERQMRTAQRQNRALRKQAREDARRVARLEVELDALHAQVIVNSLILGTSQGSAKTSAPRSHAVITAEQRRTADALCETYEAMWTEAEHETFRSLKADEGGAR